ncbi:MAG: hypothetical protein ABWX83_15535 [Luteibacter sp.]
MGLLAGGTTPAIAQDTTTSAASPAHLLTGPELIAALNAEDAACKHELSARVVGMNNLTPPPEHGDDAAVLAYSKISRREVAVFGRRAHEFMQAERDCIATMRASIDRSEPDAKIQMRIALNATFARGEQLTAHADQAIDRFLAASTNNFDMGERMLNLSPKEKADPATQKKFLAELGPIKKRFQAAQDDFTASLDAVLAYLAQPPGGDTASAP